VPDRQRTDRHRSTVPVEFPRLCADAVSPVWHVFRLAERLRPSAYLARVPHL